MYIEIKNVSKEYITNKVKFKALDNVSLNIEKGEFICLLGPSGCGKSTLLNMLAGFEKVESGSVTIDEKKVEEPIKSNVTIFQEYGLLPWRTVRHNVELGLENCKIKTSEKHKIADKFIDLVGLSKFKSSYPYQLSGGMQQRVAIARALAVNPDIIFMDEPFGALDALTRIKMQDDILKIANQEKKTIIFVTHDIEEAVFLADRIVVMTPNPGKIKTIIPVNLRHNRDRMADDFIEVRNKVFEAFEMKVEDSIEYYL